MLLQLLLQVCRRPHQQNGVCTGEFLLSCCLQSAFGVSSAKMIWKHDYEDFNYWCSWQCSNAVVSEGKIRVLRWLAQVVQYLKKVDELSLKWYWF
jgi:hypothetical protein